MTTGRINQVTILTPYKYAAALTAATIRVGPKARVAKRWDDERPTHSGMPPEGGFPEGHPFAPTKFPKGRSATGRASATRASADCDIRPSGGGYPTPTTS